MARIEWVRERLENWSRWCAQQSDGGLGFPSQSAFARLGGKGRRAEASIPVLAIDAAETDRAVRALRFKHAQLHQVVVWTYAKALPRDQVARRMSRSESTVKRLLEEADHALAAWFQDLQQRQARDRAEGERLRVARAAPVA
jgi:AraC-like DNA-binding protein